MRSDITMASSWSCVTNTKAMPTSRCSDFNSTCICRRRFASSAESGSSSKSNRGRFTSARASATRCCWPPLIFDGFALAYAVIFTLSSASATRCAISASGRFATRRPYATFSSTVRCGNSA